MKTFLIQFIIILLVSNGFEHFPNLYGTNEGRKSFFVTPESLAERRGKLRGLWRCGWSHVDILGTICMLLVSGHQLLPKRLSRWM